MSVMGSDQSCLSLVFDSFSQAEGAKGSGGWQRENGITWQGNGEFMAATLLRPLPTFHLEANTAGAQKSSVLYTVWSLDLTSFWHINY